MKTNLTEREKDYIGDQIEDYKKQNGCSSDGPCPGLKEKEKELTDESNKYIKNKMAQFDSPVVDRDFLTGAPVKLRPGDKIVDVTDAVNKRVQRATSKMKEVPFGGRYYNGREFINAFDQNGDLDFKNDPKITSPSAKEDGYQGYVKYNGKVMHQPDIGNMVYGHISRKYGNFDLGTPTDKGRHEVIPGTTTFESGHYRANKEWEENDRSKDQRAMAHGWLCGLNVTNNCSTKAHVADPGGSKDGRVKP
ncbi:hypothetical protein NUH30_18260 [Leptospira sp. 85282-16]|uniref:hypothetical protein n=1 Tax=Leptospira sp. 85282-16 TaxID=2971256 RepID=UPI0021C1852D|nr:hypothetical protein [Leptospira sp. 85282-16]MCT8335634.1 hypothetical protein [Leptospira sp. 85282-16]